LSEAIRKIQIPPDNCDDNAPISGAKVKGYRAGTYVRKFEVRRFFAAVGWKVRRVFAAEGGKVRRVFAVLLA